MAGTWSWQLPFGDQLWIDSATPSRSSPTFLRAERLLDRTLEPLPRTLALELAVARDEVPGRHGEGVGRGAGSVHRPNLVPWRPALKRTFYPRRGPQTE